MPRLGNASQSGGSVLQTPAGLSEFVAGLGFRKGGRWCWDEVLRGCIKGLSAFLCPVEKLSIKETGSTLIVVEGLDGSR